MSLSVLVFLSIVEAILVITSAIEKSVLQTIYWIGVSFINIALIGWKVQG